ncbi:uncharacterized protein V1518DRAFT_146806 [Limtongia smithiae]|uniref:uncharacterized protein n=1 Tax=Limtongia smithiae TaxID=1125753 RepID=UPI0034CD4703
MRVSSTLTVLDQSPSTTSTIANLTVLDQSLSTTSKIANPDSLPSQHTTAAEHHGLLNLPPELLIRICILVAPADFVAFTRTCKCAHDFAADGVLWRQKLLNDFGFEGLALQQRKMMEGGASAMSNNALKMNDHYGLEMVKPKSWRAAYDELCRPRRYYCGDDKWNTPWRREGYWKMTECSYSVCGKTLNLEEVCWLEASRSIRVPAGSYSLTWGLSIGDAWNTLEHLRFNVILRKDVGTNKVDEPLTSRVLPPSTLFDLQNRGWFELTVSEFTIEPNLEREREWQDLRIEIRDTSGEWKRQLNLDFIELERIYRPVSNHPTITHIPYKEIRREIDDYSDMLQIPGAADMFSGEGLFDGFM